MVNIYTEGIADKKFIEDFISHLGLDFKGSITPVNGIDEHMKILEDNAPNFLKATERDEQNIVVFDADTDFANRHKIINEKRKDLKLEFEFFLLPDNSASGTLENILCEIINPSHIQIFDCFDKYQTCLKASNYDVPDIKTKIYAYLGALLDKNNKDKAKEANRDYLNPDHWDLNHPYLNPLKEFLLARIDKR